MFTVTILKTNYCVITTLWWINSMQCIIDISHPTVNLNQCTIINACHHTIHPTKSIPCTVYTYKITCICTHDKYYLRFRKIPFTGQNPQLDTNQNMIPYSQSHSWSKNTQTIHGQYVSCLMMIFIMSDIYGMLARKYLEMHGRVLSTVVTDALVLKHQVISIHSADQLCIVYEQFHRNMIH